MRWRRFEPVAALAAVLAGCAEETVPPASAEDVIAAVEHAQGAVHRPNNEGRAAAAPTRDR
jgi:hypothetical protein